MKLCLIANPNSIHVRRWAEHFITRGDEVHLIAAHPPSGALPAGVYFHDITVGFNLPKIRYPVWARRARARVRQIGPDLVHAHFVNAGGWLGAAAGMHPFVVSAHGSDILVQPQQSAIFRVMARWTLTTADKILCVSPQLADRARALGANPDNVEVLPLGVDTTIFYPSDLDESAPASRMSMGGPVVVSLRAIQNLYNSLDIAHSIPRIVAQVPNVQFVVLTYNHDPAVLAKFKSIVGEAGANHAVRYLDNLEDDHAFADILRMAAVAISIPSSDGMPVSVQEAMACGTPLVLGDLPTLRSWIPAEAVRFTPLHDIEALAANTVDLLNRPLLGDSMGKHASAYASAHLQRRNMMLRAETVYAELLLKG